MSWYYAEQGKPVGPVDDATIQQRARDGQLAPDSLVWNPEINPEWVAARTVPLLAAAFAGATTSPAAQAFPPTAPIPPPPKAAPQAPLASGPDASNSELTRRARESLRGAWGPAIGLIVIAYAIMGVAMFMATIVSMVIPFVSLIVQYVLMPPMIVGVIMFFLARVRNQPSPIGLLWKGFNAFGSSVLTMLLLALIIMGIMLALVIPFFAAGFAVVAAGGGFSALQESGPEFMRSMPALVTLMVAFYITLLVVATWIQLRYAMIWAILADHPTMGAVATLRRSVQIMRGRKWKLCCLWFRFFGWSLLAVLTCGIGYLWVLPYMCAGYAAFYEDASARTPEA